MHVVLSLQNFLSIVTQDSLVTTYIVLSLFLTVVELITRSDALVQGRLKKFYFRILLSRSQDQISLRTICLFRELNYSKLIPRCVLLSYDVHDTNGRGVFVL